VTPIGLLHALGTYAHTLNITEQYVARDDGFSKHGFLNRKDEDMLAIRVKPILRRLNKLWIPEKRYVGNIYLNV